MKSTFILVAALLCTSAFAQSRFGGCGSPPVPPVGYAYICMCDTNGNNCQFVTIRT